MDHLSNHDGTDVTDYVFVVLVLDGFPGLLSRQGTLLLGVPVRALFEGGGEVEAVGLSRGGLIFLLAS